MVPALHWRGGGTLGATVIRGEILMMGESEIHAILDLHTCIRERVGPELETVLARFQPISE